MPGLPPQCAPIGDCPSPPRPAGWEQKTPRSREPKVAARCFSVPSASVGCAIAFRRSWGCGQPSARPGRRSLQNRRRARASAVASPQCVGYTRARGITPSSVELARASRERCQANSTSCARASSRVVVRGPRGFAAVLDASHPYFGVPMMNAVTPSRSLPSVHRPSIEMLGPRQQRAGAANPGEPVAKPSRGSGPPPRPAARGCPAPGSGRRRRAGAGVAGAGVGRAGEALRQGASAK
jgi:hypothetical protein